jgi:Arc/MetJ-type ribon-helix-helix transcriptional regulator
MAEIKYKKEKVTATVSPYIRKRIDMFVAAEEFSSVSDFVNTALAEFIGKLDYQKKLEALAKDTPPDNADDDKRLITLIKTLVKNPSLLNPAYINETKKQEEPPDKKPRVLFEGEAEDYPREWILE